MKKGMCVTLADNAEYILVDNVIYDGEKFFAALQTNAEDPDIEFFKEIVTSEGEYLQTITEEQYGHIIEALLRHMVDTFSTELSE